MPRFDPRVELRLGGQWTDITSDTRDDVRITRGRSDEASNVDPGKCSLTINNKNGTYSPRNPNSPYYGQLGRNTPIRVTMGIPSVGDADAVETDGETSHAAPSVTSRTDAGLLICCWAAYLNPGDYTVPTGMTLDAETDAEGSTLATAHEALTSSGATGTRTATFSNSNNAGHVGASVAVPGDSGAPVVEEFWDDHRYAEDVEFVTGSDTQAGQWLLAVQTWQFDPRDEMPRSPEGTSTRWIPIADSTLATNGVPRMKIWARQVVTGGAQHVVFSVAGTFRDDQNNHARLYLLSGVPFSSPRFSGEVSAWPPRWDLSEADVWVPIEASGILRRLGQRSSPIRSAIHREVTSPDRRTPVAYWPCEDGERSGSIGSGLDGGIPMQIAGSPDLAAFDGFAASGALPLMSTGSLSGDVADYQDTGETQLRWLLHISPDDVPADGTTLVTIHTTGSAQRWELTYDTSGGYDTRLIAYDQLGTEIYNFGVDWSVTLPGNLLRAGLEVTHSGSDIDFTTTIFPVGDDSSRIFSDTITGHTFGTVTRVQLAANQDVGDTAMGHLSIHNTITSIFDLGEALNAWRNEAAGRRIERLCSEEGITFRPVGDLDTTAAMGPQSISSLLDLLNEAATADGGILHETREEVGITYRTRTSIYNQGL